MDPEKVFKFLADNLADWTRVFTLTLISPQVQFQTVEVAREPGSLALGEKGEAPRWLSTRLIGFVGLSVLLGFAMNSLLRKRPATPDLLPAAVTVIMVWFFYATAAHLFCVAMRGRGRYLETLNAALQVLASIYVAVSFLTLAISSIATQPAVSKRVGMAPVLDKILIQDPALLFFSAGTFLLSIYIPIALRAVHRFGWVRTGAVGLLPYAMVMIWVQMHRYTGIFFLSR